MLLEHEGRRPRIDDSVYVAPTAVVCGDVTIGPDCRVLFGAVLTAESGPVVLGSRCIVDDDVFIATGASIFNGARIGARSVVRINGVVHIRTALLPDTVVPIGWVALGDPAQIL